MIDTTNIWSDMASRWTTALLIATIFGGSAFMCESRKQAFGMVFLLSSVAFFEIIHAIVKRLLFPSSGDPMDIAKDLPQKRSLGPDQVARSTKRIRQPTEEYEDELPRKYFEVQDKQSSMGTQTANMDSFHDAVDHVSFASPKKVITLQKIPSASKKIKSAEKRALAITRAKKSMLEDKMKVEAVMKRKATERRRA